MATRRKKKKKQAYGRSWLLLPLAIGLALAAAYALLSVPPSKVSSPPPERAADRRPQTAQPPAKPKAPPPPVHHEIGEDSREKLLEILREAEREDEP